jgi:hypothetical protein
MSKHYPANPNKPKTAIVISCPDLRFLTAKKRFCKEELEFNGREYYSLVQAGGAIALARAEALPDEFTTLFSQIHMFLQKHGDISHIILLNHEDCKKYDLVIGKKRSDAYLEREDLKKASEVLSNLFPEIQIGAYYAKFEDIERTEISFETVFETNSEKSLRRQS